MDVITLCNVLGILQQELLRIQCMCIGRVEQILTERLHSLYSFCPVRYVLLHVLVSVPGRDLPARHGAF